MKFTTKIIYDKMVIEEKERAAIKRILSIIREEMELCDYDIVEIFDKLANFGEVELNMYY